VFQKKIKLRLNLCITMNPFGYDLFRTGSLQFSHLPVDLLFGTKTSCLTLPIMISCQSKDPFDLEVFAI
jgi:hypothetical protein